MIGASIAVLTARLPEPCPEDEYIPLVVIDTDFEALDASLNRLRPALGPEPVQSEVDIQELEDRDE